MKARKTMLLWLCVCCFTSSSIAQGINILSHNAALNDAVQKVITAFPGKLKSCRGEALPPEQGVWLSNISLPNAQQCTIREYEAGKEMSCYWMAEILKTDDFNTAKKKYNELARQLQACKFSGLGTASVKLKGKKEEASEEGKINMSTFRLDNPSEDYKNIKVELNLVFVLTEWQVSITIHDRREDDAEPGAPDNNDY
jgi:hypothetical protein